VSSNFDDVGDFHEKFGLDNVTHHGPGPRDVPADLLDFRRKFLQEELDEFDRGREAGDDAQMFDALMDLVYVAMGTAHLMGYPWQDGWARVQAANMAKVRAAADGSDSKRGSAFDVVKPEGWRPPDIDGLLEQVGFTLPEPWVKSSWCATCYHGLDEGCYYEAVWEGQTYRFDSARCMRVWRLANGAYEQAGHAHG
jgi:predicted HAD superfamily Cof-like phosphohydrolase